MSTTKVELVSNYREEVASQARIDSEGVRFQLTRDLEGTERELLAAGLCRIGTSESFNNRNEMGLSNFIREHGSEVGATMVVFDITPGKARSAKKGADGRIDIQTLRADPPATMSARSYYLLRTRYYAPVA